MADSKAVEVTLSAGTKVTCSEELAAKLRDQPKKAPAKKSTSSKSDSK